MDERFLNRPLSPLMRLLLASLCLLLTGTDGLLAETANGERAKSA